MNSLTQQDLQKAVQQLRDSILGQVATKSDIAKMNTCMQQRSLTQSDIYQALDASRDRFLERLGQPFRQQQASMSSMMAQLDVINRRLITLENQLSVLHGSVRTVHNETTVAAHKGEPERRTMLSQMFS
jgi:hypothetical protein